MGICIIWTDEHSTYPEQTPTKQNVKPLFTISCLPPKYIASILPVALNILYNPVHQPHASSASLPGNFVRNRSIIIVLSSLYISHILITSATATTLKKIPRIKNSVIQSTKPLKLQGRNHEWFWRGR